MVYILFFRQVEIPPQYTGDVRFAIQAPAESVSGSQVSYEVSLENLSSAKLTALRLEIFYPDGFSFVASTPASEEGSDGRSFVIADLPRYGRQQLVIVGVLAGNVQEIKSISGKLHYVPENFASSFLAAAGDETVMLPPEITMEVFAPAHLISGQSIKYEIEITNISDAAFDDLVLDLSYPSGFSFVRALPSPAAGNTSWELPSLVPRGTQKIEIEGRLSGAPGEDVYISAELATNKDGNKLSAGRSYAFTRMLPAPIVLTHTLRGGAGTVRTGERLQYEVNYENIGDIGLSNVTIKMVFETPVFDLLEAQSNSGQIQGRQMVWQPAAVPELRVVNPGSKGQFVVRVPIIAEKAFSQKNPVAQTRMEFQADELTEGLSGNVLVFPVGTDVTLEAESMLASGPARPELGQTTVYRVSLRVENSVNDLEDAELSAVIPRTDVSFLSGSVAPAEENGNFQYQPSSRSIVWKLGRIAAFTGKQDSGRTVTFDLAMTPETLGYGNYELLRDIEVQGQDSFTDELIFSNKLKNLTTR